MTNEEKFKIAYRLTSVASTGLSFIEDYLMDNFVTDAAYLRSFYILLSYNAELILKSRVVMTGNFSSKEDLDKKLKSLSHDIIKIGDTLGVYELRKLDIKEITKNNNQYKIETNDEKKTIIEDFGDIRYDFIYGKMRKTDTREHQRIKEYINTLFFILAKSKDENSKERTL